MKILTEMFFLEAYLVPLQALLERLPLAVVLATSIWVFKSFVQSSRKRLGIAREVEKRPRVCAQCGLCEESATTQDSYRYGECQFCGGVTSRAHQEWHQGQ